MTLRESINREARTDAGLGKKLRITMLIRIICIPMIMTVPVPLNAGEELYIGKFSTAKVDESIPEGWEPLTFEKIESRTRYSLVTENNITVIQAVSDASASGLIRKIRINPRDYPIIQWRWKVSNVYRKGDVRKKSGDDYPARLYITFEYDRERLGFMERIKFNAIKLIYGEYPPIGAINYIWANKAPIGSTVPNPYTGRAKMIVVESGEVDLNKWVMEKRNIFDDYVAAFGKNPPMISGIAIMTDSDNTRESATAFYGDIVFRSVD
jgi:hypothetical protein